MDGTFVVEGNIFEGLRHTDALESDCYAPRQWEKWLHAAYCGRVYYWLEGLKVVPFHFAEYELYVKERSWYEPGGEEVGAGGYWRTSRRYRTPMRGPVLSLAEGFRARRLVAWSGGSIDVPERLVLMDRNPVWWPTRRRAARGETASSSG
jgi:competence protein CoiA